jgi:DnaJ-class molecular chaperone
MTTTTSQPPAAQGEMAVRLKTCETCNGEGTIDERLGGYCDSNPAATCPDCEGVGEWEQPNE